ncbi:MAG: symmetrical bis(5'-nucleosyl)-tetraphosphatase [Oxalobacter formigenes]|nr:symmetrical bis(5'-nucleosyl)-tetraphosphatase [Oxalobacter formigenes]
MRIYAVGDVQGCFEPLQALVRRIERETPGARYWLAGDLVNRGPHSLETLRFVRSLGERAVTVLGNHDLHLLAVAAGARKQQAMDSLDAVLNAPDSRELIDWLRTRPLAHYEAGHLLVHAGVLPQWPASQALSLAKEVETVLQGEGWADFMREIYGNQPDRWQDGLSGAERLRCIVNGLTRLRFCSEAGQMDFRAKGEVSDAPAGMVPWFEVAARRTAGSDTVVFGHWSALGLLLRRDLIGLDTGCVWGRKLTAVRLADRAVFQVDYQAGGMQDGPGALP